MLKSRALAAAPMAPIRRRQSPLRGALRTLENVSNPGYGRAPKRGHILLVLCRKMTYINYL
jgi:hypothetical protein